jgi:hypothetical protein
MICGEKYSAASSANRTPEPPGPPGLTNSTPTRCAGSVALCRFTASSKVGPPGLLRSIGSASVPHSYPACCSAHCLQAIVGVLTAAVAGLATAAPLGTRTRPTANAPIARFIRCTVPSQRFIGLRREDPSSRNPPPVTTHGMAPRHPLGGCRLAFIQVDRKLVLPQARCTLGLPNWLIATLRTRAAAGIRLDEPIFADSLGGYRDPNNVRRSLRSALASPAPPRASPSRPCTWTHEPQAA